MKLALLFGVVLFSVVHSSTATGQIFATKATLDDKPVQFGISQLKTFLNNDDIEVEKVLNATSQVVAGIMYRYTLLVKQAGASNEECTVSVWSRPWLNEKEKLTMPKQPECKKQETKSSMARSSPVVIKDNYFNPIPLSYGEAKRALAFGVDHINQGSNSLYKMMMSADPSVYVEPLSTGKLYEFLNVALSPSTCTKSSSLKGKVYFDTTCTASKDTMETKCNMFVFHNGPDHTPEFIVLDSKCGSDLPTAAPSTSD